MLQAIIHDLPYTAALIVWSLFITFFVAKKIYNRFKIKNVAVYYSRKAIHILAGGPVALSYALIPFQEPVLPLLIGVFMSSFLYYKRKREPLYWFQVKENSYEIHFTMVGGLLPFFVWFIDPTFWLAVVPLLFMSWGDAITGIVRNLIYKKRTKAWIGNLAMFFVCLPIGSVLGASGIIAAAVASFVEHFEYKWLDDNITVPLVSLGILLLL